MTYSKDNTALLIVDPYNDMLSENGKIWPRLKQVATEVNLKENIRDLLTVARNNGYKIVYVPHRRWRKNDVIGWRNPGKAHAALRDLKLYEFGTFGGEFYPEFAPQENDIICYEHWGMGGFNNTDLHLLLSQFEIKKVIIIGLTAPGCVEATGRQAMELGYSVTLVKDATAAYNSELMNAAHNINGPLYAENILTTKDVIRELL